MAEAVFNISANITPEIDERELQNQAQALAERLNGALAKKLAPVELQAKGGKFQAEIVSTSKIAEKLRNVLGRVREGIQDVARGAKSGFLKFADLIKVTNTKMTGFSGSIREAIKDNRLFAAALRGIETASDALQTLPDTFKELEAQVIAGVSPLQRAAEGGNQFAQSLVPIEQISVGIGRRLDELVGGIDQVNRSLFLIGGGAAKVSSDLSLLEDDTEQVAIRFRGLARAGDSFNSLVKEKLGETLAKGAGADTFIQKLLEIKNAARNGQASLQTFAGPLGALGQRFGIVDKDARALAITVERDLNRQIRDLGGGAFLSSSERLALTFEDIKNRVQALGNAVRETGKGIQVVSGAFLKFTGLKAPVDRLVNSFDTLSSGIVTKVRAGFQNVGADIGSSVSNLGRSIVSRLDTSLAPIARTVGQNFAALGGFLEKNLNEPLRQGVASLKAETTRLGSEVSSGLAKGLERGASVLRGAVSRVGNGIIEGLRRILRISSPSKESDEKVGLPISQGIVQGILRGQGAITDAARKVVTGAINAMKAGLTAIPKLQFAGLKAGFDVLSSAAKIGAVALAGFGAAAVHSGVQFNALQAVTKATLPVILGSAEAAKQLLQELNDLNDTSPFARSSFLELGKVLAGFGVQAQKITPLIDSIQQAIAATGGGEQDLLELGQAFARLQAQGRLSGDILQSFSSRGINILGILGKAFGKTTEEVREMISDGLVPADVAIDVLTKGMKEKFDGATDAVAKNLPGALDRIRAKTRDFGGELARAFVNPEGGGAYIDLLNNLSTALGFITKNILPTFRPAFQAIADVVTDLSTRFANFVKTLQAGAISEFLSSMSGLLPIMAGLLALLPGLLSGLPVIGPVLGGLTGAVTGLGSALAGILGSLPLVGGAFAGLAGPLGVLGVALLVMPSSLEAIKDVFVSLGPTLKDLLPKIATLGKHFTDAFGPFVAKLIRAMGPILQAAGQAVGKLAEALGPVVQAIGRFLEAVSPAIELVKNLAVIILQGIGASFKPLADVIVFLVDVATAFANVLKPVIENLVSFTQAAIDSDIARTVFEAIGGVVTWLVDRVRDLIKIINKIPGVDIKVGIDDKPAVAGQENIKKKSKEVAKAGKDAGKDITDGFTNASGAVAATTEKVATLQEQLTTALQKIGSVVEPLFDAAKAFKDSQEALGKAQQDSAAATQNVTTIQEEYARALRDVISPTDELAKSTRDLERTKQRLVDLGREERDIEETLRDLRGEAAADSVAALDRNVERAKIALNKARKDELDLLNELNKEESVGVNLAGLSLDEIKSKLASQRASLAATKRTKKEEKTLQEIEDEKKASRLDTLDAEQALKDATEARQRFEIDNARKIQENEERLIELKRDKADLLLEEQTQQKTVNNLKAGETAQQSIILDFEKRIKDAKDQVVLSTQAVSTAIADAALKEADLQLKSAIVRGDLERQRDAQFRIWELKRDGLVFDQGTETALRNQFSSLQNIVTELRNAKNEIAGARAQLATPIKVTIQTNVNQGGVGSFVPGGVASTALADAGKLLQIAADANRLTEKQIAHIARVTGTALPTFAEGGLINKATRAIVGEAGMEAILPLTRPARLDTLLANSRVLNPVLASLGRIALPGPTSLPAPVQGLSTPGTARGGPSSGGSKQDQMKRDHALAKAIVEEMLAAGLSGNQVTVTNEFTAPDSKDPMSAIQIRQIAREVKRQIERGW